MNTGSGHDFSVCRREKRETRQQLESKKTQVYAQKNWRLKIPSLVWKMHREHRKFVGGICREILNDL
jgi:hypothetical protein